MLGPEQGRWPGPGGDLGSTRSTPQDRDPQGCHSPRWPGHVTRGQQERSMDVVLMLMASAGKGPKTKFQEALNCALSQTRRGLLGTSSPALC